MSETGGSMGGKARDLKGAGGTPGGIGEFFLGAALAAVGVYLILNQVDVHTSGWRMWGSANGMGLSLLPLVVGIGVLFFNGKSMLGWFLTVAGFGIVIVGVFMTMDFSFRRTSLFNVILMLTMMAAGLGLVARSLRPAAKAAPEKE